MCQDCVRIREQFLWEQPVVTVQFCAADLDFTGWDDQAKFQFLRAHKKVLENILVERGNKALFDLVVQSGYRTQSPRSSGG